MVTIGRLSTIVDTELLLVVHVNFVAMTMHDENSIQCGGSK